MDEHTKIHLAQQLEVNEWFLAGLKELEAQEQKRLEFGDPNTPDKLAQANISLRAIRRVKEHLLKPIKPKTTPERTVKE